MPDLYSSAHAVALEPIHHRVILFEFLDIETPTLRTFATFSAALAIAFSIS
jgi:hypothetical protein